MSANKHESVLDQKKRNYRKAGRNLAMVALSLLAPAAGAVLAGCGSSSSSSSSASKAPKVASASKAPSTPNRSTLTSRTSSTHESTPVSISTQLKSISLVALITKAEAANAVGDPGASINIFNDPDPGAVTQAAGVMYTNGPSANVDTTPNRLNLDSVWISAGPYSGPTPKKPDVTSASAVAQMTSVMQQEGYTPSMISSQIAETQATARLENWFTTGDFTGVCGTQPSAASEVNPGSTTCDLYGDKIHLSLSLASPFLARDTASDKTSRAVSLADLVASRINPLTVGG